MNRIPYQQASGVAPSKARILARHWAELQASAIAAILDTPPIIFAPAPSSPSFERTGSNFGSVFLPLTTVMLSYMYWYVKEHLHTRRQIKRRGSFLFNFVQSASLNDFPDSGDSRLGTRHRPCVECRECALCRVRRWQFRSSAVR